MEGKKNNLLEALRYAGKNKPVFPCKIDKTPLTERGFKDATTDIDQIKSWWIEHPTASIGMPTGPASGVWVMDIDIPDGEQSLADLKKQNGEIPATLVQMTGSGGRQYFFQWPQNGTQIKNSASKISKDIDIRGDGGYVIVPPSGHPSGNRYKWISSHSIAPAPPWLLGLVATSPHPPKIAPVFTGITSYGQRALADELLAVAIAPEGSRNDQLNKSAFNLGQLIAGGHLNIGSVEAALRTAAIGAGLKESESQKTISSGIKSGMKYPRGPHNDPDDFSYFNGQNGQNGQQAKSTDTTDIDGQPTDNQRTTTDTGVQNGQNGQNGQPKMNPSETDLKNAVKAWILMDKRAFRIQDIYNDLNIKNRQQKKNVSDYLAKFCSEGLIERANGQRGVFSYNNTECIYIELIDRVCTYGTKENTCVKNLVNLPLGLETLGIQVMPGNIIVVAGESNAGKTSILLNIVYDNLKTLSPENGKYETIHYFSSEMGPQELSTRVSAFKKPISLWSGMKAIERTSLFHQVIDPCGLNIIDFMEVHNEFYLVGEWIRCIHEKLKDGVCVIALQKKSGSDFGRSGEISLEKPRLYLSISEVIKGYSSCKIVKAKNYTGERNPNGLEKDFRITKKGSYLEELTDWRYVRQIERKKLNAKYELMVQQEENNFIEQSIPGDETAYEFFVDGIKRRVTLRQVRQWREAFQGIDVDAILKELAYDSFEKPFLTERNWFWQVSGILGKRYKESGE